MRRARGLFVSSRAVQGHGRRGLTVGGTLLAGMVLIWTTSLFDTDWDRVHARSDAFWAAVQVNGLDAEQYPTFDALSRASDAVVVATIEDFWLGRIVRDRAAEALGVAEQDATVYIAHATLRVHETLGATKHDPGTVLILQIMIPAPDHLDALRAELPKEAALYFLRDMGAKALREHYPLGLAEELAGIHDMVMHGTSIRDFGGRSDLMADAPSLLDQFAGRPFDEVLDAVRLAVSR